MKFREGTIILLLVLSSLGASSVAPTKAELEAMYAIAARELNAGNLDGTLKQLDAIDARQPEMAAAKNLRGVALMRKGVYGPAEKALQKAREIDPEFWEARFNLAEIPFLRKEWAEARHRFEALAAAQNEQAQGTTADLIQFKILLTHLLQGKEKKAEAMLEKFKATTESPALYYGKAALALRREDKTEARVELRAAEKSFPADVNKLFAESFYEIGWLTKPDGATPVALEVSSQADRFAQAQADFGKAERAFRQRDYEGAMQLLEQVETVAPNQAVSANLRGRILLEEGKPAEAETALRHALEFDPQFIDARLNLAEVAFRKHDYEGSRQQLEALLGATSGGKAQRQREQLIRYQIFLTLLLQAREGAAQKALEDFKMMDDTPALYYAQAAWAFQHGNLKQAQNWVANAANLFSAELNRTYAASFSGLGWVENAEPAATPAVLAKTVVSPEPSATPAPRSTPRVAKIEPAASPTAAPAASPTEKPAPVVAEKKSEPPTPTPETTPKKVAKAEETPPSKKEDASELPKKKRAKSSDEESKSRARAKRLAARSEKAKPAPTPTPASFVPAPSPEQVHQNLGDKVVRLLSYPFRNRGNKAQTPAPAEINPVASPTPSPSPAGRSRPRK
ncbi:MAG: tetratricopeptide repeat protein [Spartobacteria bacterium]